MDKIIIGIITAAIASYITYQFTKKQFFTQKRYEDNEKRREALREVLGVIFPEIQIRLSVGWKIADETDKDMLLRIEKLKKNIQKHIPLFLTNESAKKQLYLLSNYVGIDPDRYIKAGIPVYKEIHDAKEILEGELINIEKILVE